MNGAVVDASLALKWVFNDETGVEAAQALRDRYLADPLGFPLWAPTLWRYEVTNGLWAATKRSRLAKSEAEQTLADLISLGISFVEPEEKHILRLACQYGIAAYDAAYLAAAEMKKCVLWTADRPLYATLRSIRDDVKWVEEYGA